MYILLFEADRWGCPQATYFKCFGGIKAVFTSHQQKICHIPSDSPAFFAKLFSLIYLDMAISESSSIGK